MTTAPAYDNSVRIGYARVFTRAQAQAQLDALAAAHCREIITETASARRTSMQVSGRSVRSASCYNALHESSVERSLE